MRFSKYQMTRALKSAAKRVPGAKAIYRRVKQLRVPAIDPAGPRHYVELGQLKEHVTAGAKDRLADFLLSGRRLQFPWAVNPRVSVVLVLFNRAELTFACLRSLLEDHGLSLEVVVIDNCSTDETERLFSRVDGVQYIRNSENLHFLRGCNQGAGRAAGKHLLFLNSDTQVLPGAISQAADLLESDPTVGAVGAKLILPDGRLQEAGSIVWRDGTCLGYGRGDNPYRAQYMYRRAVDFCSGAFLMTPRARFEALGGFDERYAPAYYEETDYCMRLWEQGYRVLYEPRCVVEHFEFASSTTNNAAFRMQLERQTIFVQRHRDELSRKMLPASPHVLPSRSRGEERRLLFVDERLPHFSTGAGYPRANEMVRAAIAEGYFVTVYPLIFVDPRESWEQVYEDIPHEAEVMAFPPFGPERLEDLLLERKGFYQTVLVSRPTTMELVQKLRKKSPELFGSMRIIYDAEAIFSLRDDLYQKLIGKPLSEEALQEKIRKEFSLAEGIAVVSTVSEYEARHFRDYGFREVHVLSHGVDAAGPRAAFEDRRGICFAGAIYDDYGSNPDAVFWFIDKVMPRFKELGFAAELSVAGTNESPRMRRETFPGVKILGRLPRLSDAYERARVFIAPTRFSAGIPLKVIEAAAHGLPVVASGLVARQLNWRPEEEILVADDPLEFARQCQRLHDSRELWLKISGGALARVRSEYSREMLRERMKRLLSSA